MKRTNAVRTALIFFFVSITNNVLALAPAAFATAVDDDSIRVNISGFNTVPSCNDTRITRIHDNVSEAVTFHAANTSTVTFDNLGGGDFYFRVRVCDANNPDEVDYAMLTTNTVTIIGSSIPIPQPTSQVLITLGVEDSEHTISWFASADAATYEISIRSQTNDDWQQGNGDTWSDWGSYNSQGTNLSKSYTGLSPSVYQYRVRACNVSGCSDPTISDIAIVAAPQFDAGDTYYLPDAKIRAIWTAPEGCLVLFENLPDACQTTFSNAHALIQFTNPNHEKMYSQVFVANAMGKNIDIWFDDNGDCSSLNTLMTIGKIEINAATQQRKEKTRD